MSSALYEMSEPQVRLHKTAMYNCWISQTPESGQGQPPISILRAVSDWSVHGNPGPRCASFTLKFIEVCDNHQLHPKSY